MNKKIKHPSMKFMEDYDSIVLKHKYHLSAFIDSAGYPRLKVESNEGLEYCGGGFFREEKN